MKHALRSGLAKATAIVVGLGIAGWLLFALPELIVDPRGLTSNQYASILIDERRTILAGFAAFGAAIGLYFRYRRHRLDLDTNATARYMQAVEQLAHEHVAVRLGGLYALERIAQDSPRDAGTVQEVISAHARRGRGTFSSTDGSGSATELTAAVRILGRSTKFESVDLTGCDLTGLDLSNLSLPGVRLGGANLAGSVLSNSDLRGASLMGCDLSDSWIDGANLEGAILNETKWSGALIEGARFKNSEMQGADLRGLFVDGADLYGVDLRGSSVEDEDQLVALAAAGGSIEVPVQVVSERWDELNFSVERPSEADFAEYGKAKIFLNFENLPRWAEHRKMPRGAQLMASFELSSSEDLPPFLAESRSDPDSHKREDNE